MELETDSDEKGVEELRGGRKERGEKESGGKRGGKGE